MTITVLNKGKRTWSPENVKGLNVVLQPQGLAEMEEVDALRFMQGYKEIVKASSCAVSTGDLQKQEQSIRDKKKALEEREKALDEREAKIKERENAFDDKDTEAKAEPATVAETAAKEAVKRSHKKKASN